MLPILCYTCGKVLGHLYYINEFTNEVFKEHGITRNCCKKVLKYSIDITDSPNAAYTKLDFEEIEVKQQLEEVKILIPR